MTKLPNDRLQDVEVKVNGFDGKMDAIERNSATVLANMTALSAVIDKPRSGPSPWLPIIIAGAAAIIAGAAAIIAGAAAIGTFRTLAYNTNKVDKLNTSINGEHGLTAREVKLETGLRLLTAVVAPQLLHEIDKALDESAKAAQDGQIGTASVTLGRVADQANALRQAGIGADQTFFSNAASTLSTISSRDAQITNPAWVSLAAYHSAVIHPKNLATIFAPGSSRAVTTEDLVNLPRDHDSSINGFKVMRMNLTPAPIPPGLHVLGDGGEIIYNTNNGDWLVPAEGGVRGGVRLVSGLVALTPSQTLDNIVWKNVVFVNARIRYLGGPVTLKNVRFVNCTFDIPAKVGQPILNYAVAQQPDLILPGSIAGL